MGMYVVLTAFPRDEQWMYAHDHVGWDSRNIFMISNVFMKFSAIFCIFDRNRVAQRDVCSKIGILAEWSINGIQNIKPVVMVHLS